MKSLQAAGVNNKAQAGQTAGSSKADLLADFIGKGSKTSSIASSLIKLYELRNPTLRSLIIRTILKLEGGDLYSSSIRLITEKFHGLKIGLYSDCHGGILNNFQPGTTIGRYCSIANSAKAYTRTPAEGALSMHALFADSEGVTSTTLQIGDDVWLGHNAVILPSVSSIGTGAVVGANSVVKSDVAPFAIMAGNPARRIGFRFPEEKISELLDSNWYQKTIEELSSSIQDFQEPTDGDAIL